ncbi:hypothetical protein Cni_G27390 [Canna indica]|uniref:FYVE-type domain-containing protein n=1 Tax=Canna indica TaxID=4628 RepID=A0AAQ3L4U2_9LILI|nr:hypothetical protein Cni_G27390 [Canna indica]
MQNGGDYGSFYVPEYPPPSGNHNHTSGEFAHSNPIQHSYASAPPYSAEFPTYSDPASYAPYSQNPEPAPSLPQSELPPPTPEIASFSSYNPSSYPPEPFPLQLLYPHQQPSSVAYYAYDALPVNPSPPTNSNSAVSTSRNAPYSSPAASSGHDVGGCFNDNSVSFNGSVTGEYGHGPSGLDRNLDRSFSDNNPYGGMRYNEFGLPNDGFGDGVYQYDGGKAEPYGSRGTAPTSYPTLFDDYGRSISFPSGGKDLGGGSSNKIVKAVPKADTQQDVKSGIQKFRVKLLPEGGGQSTIDVLCQIGLDGIRMLDPSTNRTLRIYPLDTVTRWEVSDSSTFTFWSKTSVDMDPRRIRLQSNSYTTNTILDTVTAATVQFKEIGGIDSLTSGKETADAGKVTDQSAERKKGLVDWMNLMKPANEEKDHWVPDEAVTKCTSCGSDFGAFNRRHHCRNCGDIFCDKCTKGRIALTADENAQPVRVCDRCMAEVTQRLENAKEAANKPASLQSHEDLALKLQEEMDKNRKSGSKAIDGSAKQMREVACPVCTVHLQVQVPSSGSETIECGVCQNPFLVNAH